MKFYDTNALLELQEKAFEEFFFISSTTLLELEDIKTNRNKDDQTKYNSRRLLRLLNDNTNKYYVVVFEQFMTPNEISEKYGVADTHDVRICACARFANDWFVCSKDGYISYENINHSINIKVANECELVDNNIVFVTDDLSCKLIAKNIFDLNVDSTYTNVDDEYDGYIEVVMDDKELSEFYIGKPNMWGLLTNEYLIIRGTNNEVRDQYRWDGNEFVFVSYDKMKSDMFGMVEPYEGDIYQRLALNSLMNNKLTMIKGPAGTGKSYLAIGFMLWMLEKHKIDKIVIFANPTPTANAAKLGFLPGSQLEKLADSSLGNMLGAKLSDKYLIDQLIQQNDLDILPMCDIRGFDTSGLNCAVYITEAQNLDISLMKLALQRIGEDSIAIIDGDYNTQVDLQQYAGYNNGMRRLSQVFRGFPFYGEVTLKNIYRSEIARLAELM